MISQYLDDIRAELDPVERDRLTKDAFEYGTCQFFYVGTPSRVGYTFWQPWLKGYQGESRIQVWNRAVTFARAWVNQDLKYEMIGVSD